MTAEPEGFALTADVLVLGGGPAGAWAAIAAARARRVRRVGGQGARWDERRDRRRQHRGHRRRARQRREASGDRTEARARSRTRSSRVDRKDGRRGPCAARPACRMGLHFRPRRSRRRSIAAASVGPTTCSFCAGACIRPGFDFSITAPRSNATPASTPVRIMFLIGAR